MDDPKTWVAIYAAIVATAALLLNIRTWFESRPRLKVTVKPDGMVIGAGPQFDECDLIIATVTNLGKTPVLITNLLLLEKPTLRARLRKTPTRAFVVANPTFVYFQPLASGTSTRGNSAVTALRRHLSCRGVRHGSGN